jgi:cytochrome P450
MIQERKESQLNDHHDLFSSLLAANDDENLSKGEVKLSDSELIGKPLFNLLRDCDDNGDVPQQAISSY